MHWCPRTYLSALALIGLLIFRSPLRADPIGSAPASQPVMPGAPVKSAQELSNEFAATSRQLVALAPAEVLCDPDKRAKCAAQTIPVLYHRIELLDQLSAMKQIQPIAYSTFKQSSQAQLYALDDQPMTAKVNSMAGSGDAVRRIPGQSIQLLARWVTNGEDADKAGKIVDDLEKLDRANPGDSRLSMLTINMAKTTKSDPLKNRLVGLVTDVMTDPYARRMQASMKATMQAQTPATQPAK